MKTIPLTQGKVALIDDEDYELISQRKWQVSRLSNNTFYAQTTFRINKKKTSIGMHRMIMNAPKALAIDHINGDGLDNHKRNLRFATTSQNMRNARSYKNSSSKFKGVSWAKKMKKWSSSIWYPDKSIVLGHFTSEIQAAYAYNKAAKKFFGEFARLNEI